jgi:hypothetical protein
VEGRMSKPKPASERVRFEVIASPNLIEEFYDTHVYECVRVWWKGEHFLSIKKYIITETVHPVVDPDEDRDDVVPDLVNRTRSEYVIHCEWPLYLAYHGTFETLDLARDQAIKSTEAMELFIRQKFTRRSP